jgi:protein TonB
MDRNFVISATIAAALHVGLLFGYRPSSAVLANEVGCAKPIVFVCDLFSPPELPPPDENKTENAVPEPAGGAPRPSLDEPPPIDSPTPYEIPAKLASVNVSDLIVEKIPNGPNGPGAGTDGLNFNHNSVYRPGDLSNSPRARVTVSPTYPQEAKSRGFGGEVLVEFVVDELGNVHAPTVVRSSDRVFEDAALRAVARWKFEPGKRDGRAVRFRMALPIVFNLAGD